MARPIKKDIDWNPIGGDQPRPPRQQDWKVGDYSPRQGDQRAAREAANAKITNNQPFTIGKTVEQKVQRKVDKTGDKMARMERRSMNKASRIELKAGKAIAREQMRDALRAERGTAKQRVATAKAKAKMARRGGGMGGGISGAFGTIEQLK